jgi:hypothetical protein
MIKPRFFSPFCKFNLLIGKLPSINLFSSLGMPQKEIIDFTELINMPVAKQ